MITKFKIYESAKFPNRYVWEYRYVYFRWMDETKSYQISIPSAKEKLYNVEEWLKLGKHTRSWNKAFDDVISIEMCNFKSSAILGTTIDSSMKIIDNWFIEREAKKFNL